ncbi:MAG: DUF1295 domain-containing protein [Bacteroidia bacterium]|nr:DUF1295 domain-containing protein [Bacteroidia bacterium]
MSRLNRSRGVATFWVLISYLAAFGGAIGGSLFFANDHPLVIAAVADTIGTLVIFFFSLTFNNSSLYDPYWSIAPPALGVYWMMRPEAQAGDMVRQYLVMALVSLWALRLTWNWYRGWPGLNHEDWRYLDLRKKTGKAYWLVSFSGIHFFPTVLVFVGCLSLFYALDGHQTFGWLDGVAAVVTLAGIAIEGIADNQLRAFRLSKPEPQAILETGIWKYSRHPNYFGEITFWLGLFLFSLAAAPEYWWAGAGPLAMILLFLFVSIPMKDKRMLNSRPDYAERMKKVSMLIPLPVK